MGKKLGGEIGKIRRQEGNGRRKAKKYLGAKKCVESRNMNERATKQIGASPREGGGGGGKVSLKGKKNK